MEKGIIELGLAGVVLWLVFKEIVKPLIQSLQKKNGNGASDIEKETKDIVLKFWQDNKERLDAIERGVSGMKVSIDWIYKQIEELDGNKYPLVWRNEEKDKKDHETLSRLMVALQLAIENDAAILAELKSMHLDLNKKGVK